MFVMWEGNYAKPWERNEEHEYYKEDERAFLLMLEWQKEAEHKRQETAKRQAEFKRKVSARNH